jgi:hypothetical protein
MDRRLILALAIGGLVMNSGCGGGSSTSPSPAPAPTPVPGPVTTNIGQGTYRADPLGTGALATINLGAPGLVRATLQWTFASDDVDLWVLSGTTCATVNSDLVPSGPGCTILCQDIGTTGTSATCSFNSTSGTALVWATNYGRNSESGTWIVTVTR